ncbi:MAG: hypothetical protein RIT81_17325, partial [Deltaproteobacteria bacterium]
MAAKPFEPDPLSEVQLDKDARLVINADGELVLAPSMRPGPADDLALDDASEDAGLLPDEGELGPMEAGLVIAPAPASAPPNPATADLLPPSPPGATGGPRQGGSLAANTTGDAPESGSPRATATGAPRQDGSRAAPPDAPPNAQRQGGALASPPDAPFSAQRHGGSKGAA